VPAAASGDCEGAALTDLKATPDEGGTPGMPGASAARTSATGTGTGGTSTGGVAAAETTTGGTGTGGTTTAGTSTGCESGTPGTGETRASAGRGYSGGARVAGRPARYVRPARLRRSAAGLVAAVAAQATRIGREFTPRALWERHRLMTIAVLIALLPRILAALAFRPALLTADSFLYMQQAVSGKLGEIRPAGYPKFLSLFQGLPHALLLVTTAQHLMGIAVAVIVYGLLRYWGLPGWGASLAALPVLFDSHEIALESFILPDTLFCLVVVASTALLLTRRTPRPWQCAIAALLLAYAAVLRGNGLPLIVVAGVFLLIRRVGWKAITAAAVAFAVPLALYLVSFHSQYGRYNLTESDGLFLWSRTTSFANCTVIRPPADLRPLCPAADTSVAPTRPAPPWSVSALLSAPTPSDYLWASGAWWRHDAHPGINAYNNALGMRFAERAIEAQPLDYARVVAENVMLTFLTTDRPFGVSNMTFTRYPRIARLPGYYQHDISAYAATTSNTRAIFPYAYFLLLYQQPVYFPGVLFLLVVLAGLVFVIRDWRRLGGPQLLPWALAAASILLPAMLTQSLYRYTIVAIPLSCLAVGLGFATRRRRPVPGPAANPARGRP